MNIRLLLNVLGISLFLGASVACQSTTTGGNGGGDDDDDKPDEEVLGEIPHNPFKAPLYWSVYEYHITRELNGQPDNYIPESEFLANINWVDQNLKSYGYDMVAIDGWGDVNSYNQYGYRTKHSSNWQNDYEWWAEELQSRGMNLGMYDNPLWVNMNAVNDGARIKGTNFPLANIVDPDEETTWFTWVQVNNDGAEEYVKGYVQHYADMGIKYLRVDFLSWFEEGFDKNLGDTGPDRPRNDYIKAMRWIKEACDANNIMFSVVMPALNNEAEVEQRYGHMIRINEDALSGEWYRFSEDARGVRRSYWSQWANAFDGYTYWSHIAGRNKMILDGDFIRLNTYANDDEKRSVISLHLIAGGPVTPSWTPGARATDGAGNVMRRPFSLPPKSRMKVLTRGDGFKKEHLCSYPFVLPPPVLRRSCSAHALPAPILTKVFPTSAAMRNSKPSSSPTAAMTMETWISPFSKGGLC